jgi:hypothetical protein
MAATSRTAAARKPAARTAPQRRGAGRRTATLKEARLPKQSHGLPHAERLAAGKALR